MKLTEQQLKSIFQENTALNQTPANAGDCLAAPAASDQRLTQAEQLLNDFTAAQVMKAVFKTQSWSQQIAQDIKSQSVSSWFNWMAHPFKTTFTASALAVALFFAAPLLEQSEQQMMPVQAQVDIISAAPFESDVLSSGSFDNDGDSLFNGSFG